MQIEWKYPEWQAPLRQAILDHRKLPEIQTVLNERLLSLVSTELQEEAQALIDALATIRVLKQKS